MKNTYNIASLSGAALSNIPLYGIIKIINEFYLFKKSIPAVVLTVIKLILKIIIFVLIINLFVQQFRDIDAIIDETMNQGSSETSIYFYLVTTLVIIILSVITMTFDIVVGLIFKSEAENNNYTEQEKFEYGKLAGIYLSSIPMYIPIKIITSMKDIERMNRPCSGLATSIVVLFFLNWLIALILPIFAAIYYILLILLGFKLSEEKLFVDVVQTYDYDNFDSF